LSDELINESQTSRSHVHPQAGAVHAETRASILVLTGHYLPGFKGGGPIRSLANLVEVLGKEFSFKVVTSDRDLGDRVPYSNIERNRWTRVGNADVMYLSAGWQGLFKLVALLRSPVFGGVVYLNSFFSRRFSILPMVLRRLGVIHPAFVVLAPRGEFSPGALNIRKRRKALYRTLAKAVKAYRDVFWHASSEAEAEDIKRFIGERRVIGIAEVIPEGRRSKTQKAFEDIAIAEDIAGSPVTSEGSRPGKLPGQLKIVFASRISPMKNLIGAIRMLDGISGDVIFSIYGPAEDGRYWDKCLKAIAALPNNVRVHYKGMIEHDKIAQVFADNDLFLLPTLGENYGHVICEALSAGCPALISDQTPWRNLEERSAGWDIPLEETNRFREVLQQCVEGDEAWQAAHSIGARTLAAERVSSPSIIEANRSLFQKALRYATQRE